MKLVEKLTDAYFLKRLYAVLIVILVFIIVIGATALAYRLNPILGLASICGFGFWLVRSFKEFF